MKPTRVEEILIAHLAKFAQYFYQKFGLSIPKTAFIYNALYVVVFSLLLLCVSGLFKKIELILFFTVPFSFTLLSTFLLIIILTGCFFTAVILNGSTIGSFIANTEEKNNPNKFTWWILICRCSLPIFFAAALLVDLRMDVLDLLATLVVTLANMGITLALYMYCADKPITTQKKKENSKVTRKLFRTTYAQ